jgi:hypothetical protein
MLVVQAQQGSSGKWPVPVSEITFFLVLGVFIRFNA